MRFGIFVLIIALGALLTSSLGFSLYGYFIGVICTLVNLVRVKVVKEGGTHG